MRSCRIPPLAFAGLVVAGALLASPAAAIAQRTDSAAVATPSTHRTREDRRLGIFGAGLAGGLLAAELSGVSHGQSHLSGTVHDRLDTKGRFPDKAVHFFGSAVLSWAGLDLGISPPHAALAVCASGAALEFVQRRVSVLDIAADCAGGSAAAIWRWWWQHH